MLICKSHHCGPTEPENNREEGKKATKPGCGTQKQWCNYNASSPTPQEYLQRSPTCIATPTRTLLPAWVSPHFLPIHAMLGKKAARKVFFFFEKADPAVWAPLFPGPLETPRSGY
ncbi:hypothetical protein XENTR_v10020802 [Xenopus tropicalis]|nr:hypothetical protein XENTR_v10020802 [Xenopus tropicalis]